MSVRPGGKLRWLVVFSAVLVVPTCLTAAADVPSAAAAAAMKVSKSPATLGIHDGGINRCDGNGKVPQPTGLPRAAAADTSFSSPLWSGLDVTTVRYSAPWDIADPAANPSRAAQQALKVNEECLAAWLIYAHRAKPAITSVEIAFKPDAYYKRTARGTTKKTASIPSLNVYQRAVRQFLATFTCGAPACPDKVAIKGFPGVANGALGQPMAPVTIIAPWGEPDYGRSVYEMPSGDRNDTFDNPVCSRRATAARCGPELAADMYNYVKQQCTACAHVIAGDFGSGASARAGQTFAAGQKLGKYLRVYYRYLRHASGVTDWGLHPYGDVETAQLRYHEDAHPAAPPRTDTRVYSYAATLKYLNPYGSTKLHIWLDEISSFNGTGQGNNPGAQFTRLSQAYGAQFLFDTLVKDVPPHGPTVTKIYYLNFSGPGSPNAELISPPATAYLVYSVFVAASR